MKKLVSLIMALVVLGSLFAAGTVNLQMQNGQAAWTQTLTFSVKQWIKVTWEYDEAQAFAIDDNSRIATIGNISFQSNKRFKVYYGVGNVGQLPSGLAISALKIGTTTLSNSSTTPTEVTTKVLSGLLSVEFSDISNVENDFQVKFDFTFLPF
ncbi:hypothetical protein [Fervidobacterium sp.]